MINSTLTGPMEGTDPPAASKHSGENKIRETMKSFLPKLMIKDLRKFFMYRYCSIEPKI